ncbi:SEL1-like repeat protein [Sinorhizobium sp. BG8]|uniref:tetratricopeptide repeat protein n=1 Tax=Sinorhizobium sp. BG8 TaxID=2613773 RepID=UPI00193D76C6|nr:SEL1-like repeat protein [Sinorhizobium sp. BG8]QRM54075.1 sel1 repeat family protein [Sinorhizobium sp. BG8]
MKTAILEFKTIGRAVFFAMTFASAAAIAGGATAGDLSIEAQCDASTGSALDAARNTAFAPVEFKDIKLGIALSSCREAYKARGGARIAFQLARALDRAGQPLPAMKLYEEASGAGHLAAMVEYARLVGERGDRRAEIALYTKAAEAGSPLAAHRLGVAYRDGIGTPADQDKAALWFTKAAAAGDGLSLELERDGSPVERASSDDGNAPADLAVN